MKKISTPVTYVPTHGLRVIQNVKEVETLGKLGKVEYRYFMQQSLLGSDGKEVWRNVPMEEVEEDDPRWVDAVKQDEK